MHRRSLLRSSIPDSVPSLEALISTEEIEICQHDDGRPWLLGTGSFGDVRILILALFSQVLSPLNVLAACSVMCGFVQNFVQNNPINALALALQVYKGKQHGVHDVAVKKLVSP